MNNLLHAFGVLVAITGVALFVIGIIIAYIKTATINTLGFVLCLICPIFIIVPILVYKIEISLYLIFGGSALLFLSIFLGATA